MKSKNKFAGMIIALMFALTACAAAMDQMTGNHPDTSSPGNEASAGKDPKEPVTIEFMGHGNPNEKDFRKADRFLRGEEPARHS